MMSEQNNKNPYENPQQDSEGRFTVMPEQYLPKTKSTLSPNIALVLGLIVILIAIGIGIFYVLMTSGEDTTIPVQQSTVISDTNANTDQEINDDSGQMMESDESTNEKENDGKIAEISDQQEDEMIDIDLPVPNVGVYRNDVDTDLDGLTDDEELLFDTNVAMPDTDEDSYVDGDEVVNLYDPAVPGALLDISSNVKIATDEEYNFQLLVPIDWLVSQNNRSGEQMLVKPLDGTERLLIGVYENPERLTVTQWYQDRTNTRDLTEFVSFDNELGWTGIQTRDKLLVIASIDNGVGANALVFVLHYDLADEESVRYPSVWEMMKNSLGIIQVDNLRE